MDNLDDEERRAILDVTTDPSARESIPEIVAELRRLDEVYGGREESLRNAIFCLLYWIEHPGSPIKLYAGKDVEFHRFAGVRTYTQVARKRSEERTKTRLLDAADAQYHRSHASASPIDSDASTSRRFA